MSQPKKAKVILFSNQKGGVGKTSNIINFASASLFSGNVNTVILDCDPQHSVYMWQEEDRGKREERYRNLLPQVINLEPDTMPSSIINLLVETVDEIWVDTAGFVGFKKETAQRYIEDILPYVDLIVTPLKASKLDIRSTEQTMVYLDEMLKNMGRDVPRMLLRSDIKGGNKGVQYINTLLEPLVEKYPKWEILEAFIPSSVIFTKALENGGNAFVPRNIDPVAAASTRAYAEIQIKLGLKSVGAARKSINNVLQNMSSIRQKTSKL